MTARCAGKEDPVELVRLCPSTPLFSHPTSGWPLGYEERRRWAR